jgi:hypothetical protein
MTCLYAPRDTEGVASEATVRSATARDGPGMPDMRGTRGRKPSHTVCIPTRTFQNNPPVLKKGIRSLERVVDLAPALQDELIQVGGREGTRRGEIELSDLAARCAVRCMLLFGVPPLRRKPQGPTAFMNRAPS